jgi:hypothetical protein
MNEQTDDTYVRLDNYAVDADKLDLAAFKTRHGNAFLVFTGAGGLNAPIRPRRTMVFGETIDGETLPWVTRVEGTLVFQVKRTGRSPFPDSIWVGRTRNNDIVIPDVSISKCHAMFKDENDGHLRLLDAGSRNGTFLDNDSVPVRGRGAAVVVRPGARIRFGSVDVTFVDAERLRGLALRSS